MSRSYKHQQQEEPVSRLSEIKARHKAELREAELEEDLVSLKENPGDGKKLRAVKDELRAVRLETRTAREQEGV